MNTQSNFFKTTRSKFLLGDKEFKPSALDIPRGKSSSSPTRMPLIREYGSKVKSNSSAQNPIPDVVTNYNLQNLSIMDIDKLKDELIKQKSELNKKVKEYHSLKISFSKLDEENKRNVRIIEEILEGGKQKHNGVRNEENESDIKNVLSDVMLSPNNINKLKQAHIVTNLKRQVMELKVFINNKEEEINSLKNSSKVSKYHELETKLKNVMEEFNILTERYNLLKLSFADKDSKLKETTEERDYYKAMMLRIKAQYDESKEKLQFFQDQILKLNEMKKSLEDKNTNSKFQNNSVKSQLREKENLIISLKDELKAYEEFKGEKEKMDRNIGNLSRSVQTMKEEIDRKTRRIKEMEKINTELKDKVELLTAENKKLNVSMTGTMQVTHKEKDKKIKKLEEEINQLKTQMAQLKDKNINIKNENTKLSQELSYKDEELVNYENSNRILKDKYEELSQNYDQVKENLFIVTQNSERKEKIYTNNKNDHKKNYIHENQGDNNNIDDHKVNNEADRDYNENFEKDFQPTNIQFTENNHAENQNNDFENKEEQEHDYEKEFSSSRNPNDLIKEENTDRSERPNPADLL